MISLRSAASTAQVSAWSCTGFRKTYLVSGIPVGPIRLAGAARDRVGRTRGVAGQRSRVRRRGRAGRHFGGLKGPDVDVERVMAGSQVAVPVVGERRLDVGANVGRVAAALMEAATARRVDRAGHVALEDDTL